MSLNLDAIKNKLSNLNNQGAKSFFKPQEGEQTIRIVPAQYQKDNPFYELFFHYEVTDKTTLSPKTYGNPDPILELAEQLKSEGGDAWAQGRKIEPKMRTFVPIIVRGKEDDGVKWWGFGVSIYKELMEIMTDPDWGDITDLAKGRDIKITFVSKEKSDSNFPKTSIMVKPQQTPATTDKGIADLIMNKQPKLNDLFPEPSYQELKDALVKWSTADGSDSEEEEEEEGNLFVKNKKSVNIPETASEDISAKMADIFSQIEQDKRK